MLTDQEKQLIQRSWRLVIPIAETAADLFYQRLFELRPEYQQLFSGDLRAQKRKLVRMLAFVVRALDWPDASWREEVSPEEDLMLVVLALGRRHKVLYKIPDESYAVVGEALLWTLKQGLGDAFTDEVKGAWAKIYGLLSKTMRMASAAVDALPEEEGAVSATVVQERGDAALLEQQAAAGIDDAKLGFV